MNIYPVRWFVDPKLCDMDDLVRVTKCLLKHVEAMNQILAKNTAAQLQFAAASLGAPTIAPRTSNQVPRSGYEFWIEVADLADSRGAACLTPAADGSAHLLVSWGSVKDPFDPTAGADRDVQMTLHELGHNFIGGGRERKFGLAFDDPTGVVPIMRMDIRAATDWRRSYGCHNDPMFKTLEDWKDLQFITAHARAINGEFRPFAFPLPEIENIVVHAPTGSRVRVWRVMVAGDVSLNVCEQYVDETVGLGGSITFGWRTNLNSWDNTWRKLVVETPARTLRGQWLFQWQIDEVALTGASEYDIVVPDVPVPPLVEFPPVPSSDPIPVAKRVDWGTAHLKLAERIEIHARDLLETAACLRSLAQIERLNVEAPSRN